MQEFKPVKEGKVREIYDNGDNKMVVPCQTIMYNQSYSLQTGSFRNENFVDIKVCKRS